MRGGCNPGKAASTTVIAISMRIVRFDNFGRLTIFTSPSSALLPGFGLNSLGLEGRAKSSGGEFVFAFLAFYPLCAPLSRALLIPTVTIPFLDICIYYYT